MLYLILGVALFIGVHSVRIFAEQWRTARVARMGAGAWKGVYSLISVIGFALIIYGYGLSRQMPVELWAPPIWTRHVTALLTLLAFILLAAAYVPRNHIKAKFKHPMMLSVKLWALAHLLSNGRLDDVLLFGSFALWAAFAFRAARQRDRQQAVIYQAAAGPAHDFIVVAIGIAAWVLFALYVHGALIGVRPFG